MALVGLRAGAHALYGRMDDDLGCVVGPAAAPFPVGVNFSQFRATIATVK